MTNKDELCQSDVNESLFRSFSAPLIGLPVSHVWRGHGSALFLEFGALHQKLRSDGTVRVRRDGSPFNPSGEWGLMIEWSWRIEGPRSIFCGSWSDERRWLRAFALLRDANVTTVNIFGRLPEIEINLSNRLNILSFMTSDGSPRWVLFDRRGPRTRWITACRNGLQIEERKDRDA